MRASLAFLSVVASAIAQGLQVNTPASATLCQPTAITYSGGTAPYYLTVLPGGMVGATPLISFPTSATLTAGTYTWLVNIAAGTSITLQVKDSTGTPAYSSPITIGANTDANLVSFLSCRSSSCLTATTPSAGGAATGATTGAATSAAGTSAASSPASSAAGTTAVAAGTSSPAVAATTSSRVATGAASTTPAAAASSKPASAGTTAVSMLALFGAAVVAIAA
ncbi:hypothetical protein RQP46_005061 [Phenoliferia psychrophenolica]